MPDDNPQPVAPKPPQSRPSDDLTTEQLIKKYGNKSAAIRALYEQGYTTSEIAKKVDVIYQHARNVILRPLKRVNHKESDGD